MMDSYYSSTGRAISSFMYKVYAWMSAGLLVTAATAYGIYSNPVLLRAVVTNKALFWISALAQIGLVFYFMSSIASMSYERAKIVFLTYSVLVGTTTSIIFAVYTMQSIGMVFAIAAGMFACMALYGYFTGADLTSAGNILNMALMGLVVASVINMFVGSNTLQYVLSYVGVLIFSGLTAYDVQKIKYMGYEMIHRGELESKVALAGALILYLDFINLFFMLLQLFGDRRRD